MAIAGVDVGTTGCKCTVCGLDGSMLGEAYEEYDVVKESGGRELDAWEVWQKVKSVIRQAARSADKIHAIGVTSFGETSVFIGEDGKPLMNALLYVDACGEEQCRRLEEHFGADYIFRVTGARPHSMYSISKLMWMAEYEKDVFARTKHICQFGDYIVYMLSGKFQIDYSLACRSMAFDYRKLDWSDEILNFAGIDCSMMSQPAPTGSRVGLIRRELAEELGLTDDVVIVSGCHDQVAAAIGTGCLKKGMAVDGTGTAECITPVFPEPQKPEAMFESNLVMVPYIGAADSYVTYAFSFNGGSLLKWYRDNLASLEAKAFSEKGISPYDGFNAQMKAGKPSGLLVLPYFSGAATPYMDAGATDAILGITDSTTSIDIYQALMEGVTYEMMLNLECLQKAGIEVSELRATGGGARAEAWLQMKADILNKKIVTLGNAQSGTLGCIMMSGVACGVYESLEAAADIFVKTGKEYLPNPENHARYMEYYEKYKKLYPAVKEVWA
ncbi:MAG: carbohydrate kinase [Lachnospiraceae bacterium]|nr:carbohydrate kinase [Lachnospiraceae bacterium]